MTETNTDQTSSSSTGSKFTTVKTIYARAAVVLLAFNFCLTGYVVMNMNQLTQGQIDDISSQSIPTVRAASPQRTSPLESQEEPQVKTRENKTTKK